MNKENSKKEKKVKSPEEKRRSRNKALIITGAIFGVIIISISIIAIVTAVSANALLVMVNNVGKVQYSNKIITPLLDEDNRPIVDELGCYNFVDDEGLLDTRDFKVLQLSDIHIGAGAFSIRKDNWTIKTVEDLIRREQPDLVVVTGDIAYPVFFQAGTMNNKNEMTIFADLMEKLEVYWTCIFGNHDSEIYSYNTREDMAELLTSEKYEHCLFNDEKPLLDSGEEVSGVGNFIINVKDKNNDLVHTMFMMDSHSYLSNDPFGLLWKYDKIHDDQIEWYETMSKKLNLVGNKEITSTIYFHIPFKEYMEIQNSWRDQINLDKIALQDGFIGEYDVGGSVLENDIIKKMFENNSAGAFCGHNHMNNASYIVDRDGLNNGERGVKLAYGMSIDYLAYPGIYKKTAQRGGRVILLNSIKKLHEPNHDNYDASKFAQDKEYGFTTYLVPYWNNLYKNSDN